MNNISRTFLLCICEIPAASRTASESAEARERRLARVRARRRDRLASETAEEKKRRLAQC